MSSITNPIVLAITSATGTISSVANAGAALLHSGPAGVTNAAGNVGQELWYIQAKGSVQRLNLLANPTVSPIYAKSLEQGRLLESSIGDAMTWIQEKKEEYTTEILQWMHLNLLGTDGQLSDTPRAIKYIADCVLFVQQIQKRMAQVQGLVLALEQDITTLLSIETNVLKMIQQCLNMLSALLADICNWGLPGLPSIPNIVGDTMFRFNGFGQALSLQLSKPNLSFNFSFSQCSLSPQNLSIFNTTPTSVATSIPNAAVGATPIYTPPLGGVVLLPTVSATDPDVAPVLQSFTSAPIYSSSFDPFNNMLGSVPNPSSIVNNYQMPASVYQANIVSITPSLSSLVLPPGSSTTPTTAQTNALKSALRLNITLEAIEDSNFDPYITSAWLYELNLNRQLTQGRGGQWITNFQAVYQQYLQPSITLLTTNPVPWNNLGGTLSDTPTIPLIALLQADVSRNLAWKLSYIEAALLGYPRTQLYEQGADSVYLSSFTGSDLDYISTPVDMTAASAYILGEGTADYPVSISYPTSMNNALMEAIAQASLDIANTPSYQATSPAYRYIYDQFAQALLVDRYSQFWREYRANLSSFLRLPLGLVEEIVSYPAALNSAINPLAPDTIFETIQTDYSTKNQNWTPGSVLLSLPVEEFLPQLDNTIPSGTPGWTNGQFDAATFLARPDIQSQTIPVQMAMLRTNQSYAGLMTFSSQFQTAVSNAVTQAQTMIGSVQNSGAHVLTNVLEDILASSGPTGVPVVYQSIDYDNGPFLLNSTTIQFLKTGTYMVSGDLNWGTTLAPATLGYYILLDGTITIATNTVTSGSTAAQVQTFSFIYNFSAGDTFQVFAFTNEDTTLAIGTDVTIGALPTSPDTSPVGGASVSSTDLTARTLIADATLVAGQCVSIDGSGKCVPVVPTHVALPSSDTAFNIPYIDGVTLTAASATQPVTVATAYGCIYTVPGASFTVGGIIYVAEDGTLTQDYTTVLSTCDWTVVVGRALTTTTMLFQPHLPYSRWDDGSIVNP
jgi:hypothetical protein